jgi:hypothetical protein
VVRYMYYGVWDVEEGKGVREPDQECTNLDQILHRDTLGPGAGFRLVATRPRPLGAGLEAKTLK